MAPSTIIIVPYRDRASHRTIFLKHMPDILLGIDYEIVIVHQDDRRPFNRGAIKNIGFLYAKKMYPEEYRQIILVFHDIDIMPWKKGQFSYWTNFREARHFYGYENVLGGIVAIRGVDFERINGFPNIWTWGWEDTILGERCKLLNININNSELVDYHNYRDIIHVFHGVKRLISNNIAHKSTTSYLNDGINQLYSVYWVKDYMDWVDWGDGQDNGLKSERLTQINVKSFETGESLLSPYVRHMSQQNVFDGTLSFKPGAPVKLNRMKFRY